MRINLRRALPAVLAVSTGVLLSGCWDQLPVARLTNNTGSPIVLLIEPGLKTERGIDLETGATKKLLAYGRNNAFGVELAGCQYIYRFPSMGVNFPFEPYKGSYPVIVQVQPDLGVYILPSKAEVPAAAEVFENRQHHDFPMRPIAKRCY